MANRTPEAAILAAATIKTDSHPLETFDKHGQTTSTSIYDQTLPPQTVVVARNNAQQYMTKPRALAVFLAWFTQGVNDAVAGALLPYIESNYGIKDYTIASLIFVGNAVGFLAAAPVVQQLERRFGRPKLLPLAAALNVIAYAIIIAQPPFAVVVVCFVLNGFGFSINLALNNSFVANAPNSGGGLMGTMQAGYGLGGTIAPLLATAMVSNGIRWSFFYFVSLALCVINVTLLGWSFRKWESPPERTLAPPTTSSQSAKARSPLQQALRDRTTLLGALFIFAYQGAEVTISGWVVSFLIDYRQGDPARVGYVTAGFWAGITVGRFVLCPPIHRLGERFTVPGLILIWACLHVAIWLSRDIIGDAVTVAIVGLLTGPIAPVVTTVLGRLLNPRIQMVGISIGWSVGSGGAALAPFVTGVLSGKFGTVVLNPVCIVLCIVMESAWLGLPSAQWKRQ